MSQVCKAPVSLLTVCIVLLAGSYYQNGVPAFGSVSHLVMKSGGQWLINAVLLEVMRNSFAGIHKHVAVGEEIKPGNHVFQRSLQR